MLDGSQHPKFRVEVAENGAVACGRGPLGGVRGTCASIVQRTQGTGFIPEEVSHLSAADRHNPGNEFRLAFGPAGGVRPKDLQEAGLDDIFGPLLCPASAQPRKDQVKEKNSSMPEQVVQRVRISHPGAEQSVVKSEALSRSLWWI